MKKKSLLMFAIAAMLALAGCSGETAGTNAGDAQVTQGSNSGEEGVTPGESKPTNVPEATMSPEQKELAEHLRTAHEDEISAQLVEQGYYYEVNKSNTAGIFQIDFKAVTGDMRDPMLVFDVYVNDAELAAEYDKLKLCAYTLGDEVYDNERDYFAFCEGYGIRDEEADNLYHVTLPGASAWMTMGDSFVVDACQVEFVNESGKVLTYPVEVPETRLTIPQTKFHPVLGLGYVGFSFTHGGREYVLNTVEYGKYRTELRFYCYEDKEAVAMDPVDFYRLDDSFRLPWMDFLSDVTLEVDGKIYEINDNGSITFSENGSTEEQYRGSGFAYTPGVNFPWAKEAKIWVGTMGYDLKSGSKTPLTRELPTPTPAPAPTVSAEQTEFAKLLRDKFKDEQSANLVEQGYYHCINETREDGIFRFDFKGLTGDKENLMMAFDVYVEDDVLTEMYPILRLDVDCEREENYDPEENWWNCTGYGVQDPENKKLYHVIMRGYNLGYAPTVTDICRVAFDVDTNDMNGELGYEVKTEPYYVDVPLKVFADVLRGSYYGIEFTCGGRTYELVGATYGSYYADMMFRTVIDATEVPTDDTALLNYRDELQKDWAEAFPSLTLVADGKEYKVVDEEGKRGYIWFTVEEGVDSYLGEVHPFFPAIDYWNASELKLKVGDTEYNLK